MVTLPLSRNFGSAVSGKYNEVLKLSNTHTLLFFVVWGFYWEFSHICCICCLFSGLPWSQELLPPPPCVCEPRWQLVMFSGPQRGRDKRPRPHTHWEHNRCSALFGLSHVCLFLWLKLKHFSATMLPCFSREVVGLYEAGAWAEGLTWNFMSRQLVIQFIRSFCFSNDFIQLLFFYYFQWVKHVFRLTIFFLNKGEKSQYFKNVIFSLHKLNCRTPQSLQTSSFHMTVVCARY